MILRHYLILWIIRLMSQEMSRRTLRPSNWLKKPPNLLTKRSGKRSSISWRSRRMRTKSKRSLLRRRKRLPLKLNPAVNCLKKRSKMLKKVNKIRIKKPLNPMLK